MVFGWLCLVVGDGFLGVGLFVVGVVFGEVCLVLFVY